jgi:protein-tyrosine phosphatase
VPDFSILDNLRGRGEINIEMVCHGNICRSPMAAAILANKVSGKVNPKIIVSSSGVSDYHQGEGPHKLSKKVWEAAGYKYEHTAKQFRKSSFGTQDLILCMDLTNRAIILNATNNNKDKSKIFLLRQFDPAFKDISPVSSEAQALQVPDPWGQEIEAYEEVREMIERAIDGLLSLIYQG